MSEVMQETRYECVVCREWYEQEEWAVECCAPGPLKFEVYICSECATEYRNRNEAEECCEEGADE